MAEWTRIFIELWNRHLFFRVNVAFAAVGLIYLLWP